MSWWNLTQIDEMMAKKINKYNFGEPKFTMGKKEGLLILLGLFACAFVSTESSNISDTILNHEEIMIMK